MTDAATATATAYRQYLGVELDVMSRPMLSANCSISCHNTNAPPSFNSRSSPKLNTPKITHPRRNNKKRYGGDLQSGTVQCS